MSFWIVIPTYNEKENLARLVQELWKLKIPGLHMLVVDDNSPDGTGQLADRLGRENRGKLTCLHRSAKLGLGTAYLEGFDVALKNGADLIGQMDADFSHPVEKIPELLRALEKVDVVIGSRYVPGGSLDIHWAFWRKQLSSFGNAYARTILGLPIRDVTGGFKIWKRSTLDQMPLERVRSNGYVFQVEMNYLACRLGFKFAEVPIYFTERTWGESKMSFHIQTEAAVEVWELLARYRDIQSIHPSN
jgi:dolichol-phosphate mannosyltransferase